MRLLILLSVPLLSACNTLMYIDADPGNSGQSLARGQSTDFRFFTTDSTAHSGVNMAAGATYRLEIPIVSNWIDGTIDADADGTSIGLDGFADSQMPLQSLERLKRSRQHRWFELMLYQDGCRRDSLRGITDLSFDAASSTYLYQAPCDGDLKLFVNDTQGAYTNNVGFAHIRITRTN